MPISVAGGFNAKNREAQKAAKKRAGNLIRGIEKQTRDGVRAVVVRSINEGIPPLEAARMIRGMVGLTDQQSQATFSYWKSLVDLGLSGDRIARMVDRFAEGKLIDRSRTIARTEVMSALNEGALIAAGDAVREGLLDSSSMKEWLVTPDEKLCPVCEQMEGVRVPLSEPFLVDGEDLDSPPAHPNCRCSIVVTNE